MSFVFTSNNIVIRLSPYREINCKYRVSNFCNRDKIGELCICIEGNSLFIAAIAHFLSVFDFVNHVFGINL